MSWTTAISSITTILDAQGASGHIIYLSDGGRQLAKPGGHAYDARPGGKDSLHPIGSVLKSMVGLCACGCYGTPGSTRWDTAITSMRADSAEFSWSATITANVLMSMRAGLPLSPPSNSAPNSYQLYEDCTAQILAKDLKAATPAVSTYSYSNFGLWGVYDSILSDSDRSLRFSLEYIFRRLGLKTATLYDQDLDYLFVVGDTDQAALPNPVQYWDTNAMWPAGGIYMSVADLEKFLVMMVYPDKLGLFGASTPHLSVLTTSGPSGVHVTPSFLYDSSTGVYFRQGDTIGHHTIIAFNPTDKKGVIGCFNIFGDGDNAIALGAGSDDGVDDILFDLVT